MKCLLRLRMSLCLRRSCEPDLCCVRDIIFPGKSVSYTRSFTYRTNTVVIIDADNNATFVERTMEEPINVENIHWKTNKFEFKIDS